MGQRDTQAKEFLNRLTSDTFITVSVPPCTALTVPVDTLGMRVALGTFVN